MAEKLSDTIIRRSFVKSVLKRVAAFTLLAAVIYGAVAMVYATRTIFKVKKNYAMVLERLGGRREAITEVGWHMRLPFFTRIEQEVPFMNQILYLGGASEPVRIISSENVTLWTSAMLTYRIRDLRTWAIENLDPLTILHGDYDGIVKDILQAQKVRQLISQRESIKEEIFTALTTNRLDILDPALIRSKRLKVMDVSGHLKLQDVKRMMKKTFSRC